jgi:hypothetical protein
LKLVIDPFTDFFNVNSLFRRFGGIGMIKLNDKMGKRKQIKRNENDLKLCK